MFRGLLLNHYSPPRGGAVHACDRTCGCPLTCCRFALGAGIVQTVYRQAWATAMNDNLTTSLLNMDLEVGLGRTYRYLEQDSTLVRHQFGFGLSYTSFAYSGLAVKVAGTGAMVTLEVKVVVANTGAVDGDEVVQVYISGARVPGLMTPRHSLVGFSKVHLEKGMVRLA